MTCLKTMVFTDFGQYTFKQKEEEKKIKNKDRRKKREKKES